MIRNLRILFHILLSCQLFSVDFNSDIAPIIYNNCTSCHRNGQIGSFLPLTNYDEIFNNRFWIAYAIEGDPESRHGEPIMPPWPADRSYSTLLDEMYLSEEDIHLFSNWIQEGAMQGDPNNEYPMPFFPQGSSIGEPDTIMQMSEDYFISGDYEDDYRCFVIETGFDDSKDIVAMEFVPGNLEAVHHALIVAVPRGSVDYLDAEDSMYGYECFGDFGTSNISDFLGGYAPGTLVRKWPAGMAQQIPENSDLVMQIHYAPLSTQQTDKSSLNIFFSDEPVDRYINEYNMVNSQFALAPNQVTEVNQTWTIEQDISLIQFLPHSHLLGKSWEIFATLPVSEEIIPIIRINEWNFDWQFFYSPEYMIYLPAGSIIHASCIYDNTSNSENPNPQWTFWGEGTNDEMFFVPFRYVLYQEGDENIYLGDNDECIAGDINEDESWNVLDVVALANCVLASNCHESSDNGCASDMNGDGDWDVLDVVALVNLVLS